MRTRRITLLGIPIGCKVEARCTNGDPGAGYELIQEVMGDESTRPLMNAGSTIDLDVEASRRTSGAKCTRAISWGMGALYRTTASRWSPPSTRAPLAWRQAEYAKPLTGKACRRLQRRAVSEPAQEN